MISRRLIRVKVFKILFSRIHAGNVSISDAEKDLIKSFEKTYELYRFLLVLPLAVREVALEKIQIGLKKFHPSEEEANPNRRFVNNAVLDVLENDKTTSAYLEKRGLSWRPYEAYVKKLYKRLQESDYYQEYMNEPEDPSFADDLAFITKFYAKELENDEELYNIVEDINFYCCDEIAYVVNVILRSIKPLKSKEQQIVHPPLFKDDEVGEYARILLGESIKHYEEYSSLVGRFATNWELERVAATDVAIIVMGLTEAVVFTSIPVKVTINEMVEIAKCYSTSNSKGFVNGILDKLISNFIESKIIVKSGRGLNDGSNNE